MNSLKNTIVAILLLGVSYGVYQILTTAEPKALSTAEFHAATAPEIEIPGEVFDPSKQTDDRDASPVLASQPQPPQFNAPPVLPPANVAAPAKSLALPERETQPASPASTPAPWTQLPANQNPQVPALSAGNPASPSTDSTARAAFPPLNSSPSPASLSSLSPSNSTLPPPSFNPNLGSNTSPTAKPEFPQNSAPPFGLPSGANAANSPNRTQSEAAAIPAQSSAGSVGLTSASAPLPSLENSLQTARQLVAAGQMRQALGELSSQLHNPELEMLDQTTLYKWLDSLAGKVIYSSEHHLAAQAHIVQPNETLASLAEAWQVPPQLVYNLNRERIPNSFELSPGTELKKVAGPFRAELDLNRQTLTLYLNELYAGRFRCVAAAANLPSGSWKIENKMESGHPSGQFLMQTNQAEVSLHAQPADGTPAGCCFSQGDARDLFSILSVGSEIKVIR